MTRVLHYLNQFFAGIGGEDKANHEMIMIPRAVGAGNGVQQALKYCQVSYATVACGDNYFHEQEAQSLDAINGILEQYQPDIFLAGPAFGAGRYGLACAKISSWVRDNWRIPAITAMHEDNPGTLEIGRHVMVIQTADSAVAMQDCIKRYAQLIENLVAGDQAAIESFRAEFCLPIPRRFTGRADRADYVRAVDALLAKLQGAPYENEIPRIEVEAHRIPNLTVKLGNATLALVTEGGLVPQGNPDRLESTRGSKYLKYSILGLEKFTPGEFQAMHTGYDTSSVDRDPDRIVPLDAMRVLEHAKKFGKLHDHYFVTTGTGAMPSKMEQLGQGIAGELADAGVNGVILTAT